MDNWYATLDYKHQIYVEEWDEPDFEPSDYMTEIEGHVVINFEMRRSRHRERAGRFKIYVIDIELALMDGVSVFDVFDTHAGTVGYFDLYRTPYSFKAKVNRAGKLTPRFKPNLLILDRLEISPKYRRKGVGLSALRSLTRQFGMGCGAVAMKPFPLQFEHSGSDLVVNEVEFKKLGLSESGRNWKTSLAKLRAHYSRLGFARVPGTDYMVAHPLMGVPSLDAQFF